MLRELHPRGVDGGVDWVTQVSDVVRGMWSGGRIGPPLTISYVSIGSSHVAQIQMPTRAPKDKELSLASVVSRIDTIQTV